MNKYSKGNVFSGLFLLSGVLFAKPSFAKQSYTEMSCEVADGNYKGYRYQSKGGWVEKTVEIRWFKKQLNFLTHMENAAGEKQVDKESGNGSYGVSKITADNVVAEQYDLYDAVPGLIVSLDLTKSPEGKWAGTLYYDSVEFGLKNCSEPKTEFYSEDD